MRRDRAKTGGPRALRAPGLALWILLCGVPAVSAPALADETRAPPEVLTLEEAARFLRVSRAELGQLAEWRQVPARRVGADWRFSRSALLEWLTGDAYVAPALAPAVLPPPAARAPVVRTTDHYHADAAPPGAQALAPAPMAGLRARGTTVAQAPPPAAEQPATGAGEIEPIGEAPDEETAEDVFLRAQRVLLAPGEVTLELGLFYSRSDDQQLALVGSGVGLATVEQDTFTSAFTGRYGLFEETELFASSSFRHQETALFFGSQELSDSSRTEFGDVRLGVRHTLLREGKGVPDVIVTADGRVPTGDTSYALGGGLALIKSVDPVVLFASANYRHTFSRDFADVTRLEAEDRVDATLGYALALNDTLTLSTAVSGLFTLETAFANATLRAQESFSLQFGLTSLLTKDLYIEPTVSFGLNGPGNSVVFGVSLPYTFGP